MKKLILVIFCSAVYSTFIFAADNNLSNLGMVSQLVEIKYSSEAYLSSILGDTTRTKAERLTALNDYNSIRVQIDRIIYQLAADMRIKNSVKTYKYLNKYYKKHFLSDNIDTKECCRPYTFALANAYKTYNDKINQSVNGKWRAFIDLESVLSITELGWTIIKDINEMRGQKVDGIVEILNNLRLSPPSELNKK